MEFKVNVESAVLGLMAARKKVWHTCITYGNAAAVKMEGYAKENAPWTDRTGHARQTITGSCDWNGSDLIIAVAGNEDYSPFLELCNEGKYAIFEPTVNALQSEVVGGFAAALRRTL